MEDMKNPIRLLICSTCKTVEELPPYSGDPRGDTWLREKEATHLLPSGEKMHGDVRVGRIEQEDWLSHKQDILGKLASEMTAPGQGAGLGEAMYAAKDNYSVDAMKCWRVGHQRTLDCPDYMTSKMRVLPDTKAERKAEGMTTQRPSIYICQFCPVHSVMMQRQRAAEGEYNFTS